jgi:transketolase N-terminal domain/subunit
MVIAASPNVHGPQPLAMLTHTPEHEGPVQAARGSLTQALPAAQGLAMSQATMSPLRQNPP